MIERILFKTLKVFILIFLNIMHLAYQFMKKMDTFLQLMKNLENGGGISADTVGVCFSYNIGW